MSPRLLRQRGQALLLMLLVLGLGSTWYLVSRLNAESSAATALRKTRNAEVLNRAKQALIGYIGAQAIKVGETRPGAFPCPEAPADFNVAGSEGTVSYPCTLPVVGRFPWATLGTEKLVDAYGEPLWYVVASGWAGAGTVINSDCASPSSGMACATGRLTVDGTTGDVVALIIAPGPAVTVPASAGCTARAQSRSTVAPPDLRNYLECENATSPADTTFVTSNANSAFNDQVVTVSVGEVMPVIEAAIAKRIEREIVPALSSVYTPAGWGFSGANAVLPYPAAFANPGPGAGTSAYQGTAGLYRGLLPFNQVNCTVAASNPRCSNNFLVFSKSGNDAQIAGAGSIRTQSSCAWTSNTFICTGQYNAPTVSISFPLRVTNVAMGLRAFDASKITCTAVDDVGSGIPTQTVPCTSSYALQPDGSALVTVVTGAMPDIAASGWGTYANYMVNIDRLAFGDHSLLDTANGTTGWFARNEWFRLTYYAIAPSNAALRLPLERSCSTAGDCLSVTNMTPSSKAALLLLAGRGLNGVARPSPTLTDYLEFGNAAASYESRQVTGKPAAVYADTGGANAYVVPVASVNSNTAFFFRATAANTGTATLTTPATGSRSLVNEDGSNLAAGTIQAGAAVQVAWDGTSFRLSRRPYNDRIVAISSN